MKKIILISIILLMLTIGAVNATDDNMTSQDLTVSDDLNVESAMDDNSLELNTNPDDSLQKTVESDLASSSTGSFKDLNSLIKNSKKNSKIKFTKDYTYNKKTDSDFEDGFYVKKTLTIDGQGHVIDGKNNPSFIIAADNVILKNLVLKNTHIEPCWDNCTIVNCSFIGCFDEYEGGAIYSDGQDCRIINCSFIGCSANEMGGAISSWIGECTVIGCNFINCSDEFGCAIYFDKNFTLADSSFINGSWYGQKSGFVSNVTVDNVKCDWDVFNSITENDTVALKMDYTIFSSIPIDVDNVVIDGQGHKITGKGIFDITGNNVLIKNCNFEAFAIDCNGVNCSIINCSFIDSSSSRLRKAIVSWNETFSVVDCIFISDSDYYEGIAAVSSYGHDCRIANCSFVNSKYGDAIYFDDVFTLTDSSFINGSWHSVYAGFISNVTVDNVHYDNDIFNNLKENDTVVLEKDFSNHLISPIPISENNIIIDGQKNTITGNSIFYITGSNVTLKNCNFMNCSNAVVSNGSDLKVVNCSFINCHASINGAAIKTFGENCNVINCSFINNTVYSSYHYLTYDIVPGEFGGAIYSTNDLSVINSSFMNNSASSYSYYRDMDAIVEFYGGSGGAIYCFGDLYIEKSDFTRDSGYAVVGLNSTLINDCIFTNGNKLIAAGSLIINNSQFANNTADDAPLITCENEAKLANSSFINNIARNEVILDLNKYELTDCTFTNNNDATIYSKKVTLDDSLNSTYIFEAKIKNKIASTYYNSGKQIKVEIINVKSKKTYYSLPEVYRNGKSSYDYKYDGSLTFPVSTWKVGTYTVTIKYDQKCMKSNKITFKITVKKASTIVKAPKVTNKYKKSKYFKVTVKNKATKKAVKNTYVKLKIDKKTYKIKTDSKGVAKFNTKNLKIGKHKVTITSGNSNYKMSAKSTITIKK